MKIIVDKFLLVKKKKFFLCLNFKKLFVKDIKFFIFEICPVKNIKRPDYAKVA